MRISDWSSDVCSSDLRYAGLAHDFRNILAIIESGLSLAERNRDEAALVAAHEGIRRGIRLTSQLVLFARPEKLEVHSENVKDLLNGLKAFLKYGSGPGIASSTSRRIFPNAG